MYAKRRKQLINHDYDFHHAGLGAHGVAERQSMGCSLVILYKLAAGEFCFCQEKECYMPPWYNKNWHVVAPEYLLDSWI